MSVAVPFRPATGTAVPAVPGTAPTAVDTDRARRAAVARRAATRPFRGWLVAVVAANAVAVPVVLATAPGLAAASTVAAGVAGADVALAALVRQQNVVNGLFRVATAAPLRWPLRVRAALAQVHQVGGGVHVGAALSAIGWFLAFTAMTAVAVLTGPASGWQVAILVVALAVLAVLLVMAVEARPSVREGHHDRFEHVHRWGGWSALVLLAGLTVLLGVAAGGPLLAALAATPGAWILLVVAVAAVVPWLQLRRVPVTITTPSDHVALVTLDRGRRVRAGSVTRIARRPLGQWHAFANMTRPETDAYRLAVSRVGDWTSRFIDERPDVVWVRGVPTTGVGTVGRLFHRVVWVATGSGIAPALPHLVNDPTPAHLIWVTRNPERTYGPALLDEIRTACPDTTVWDTDADGKPDLAALAARAVAETGAEAVVCISNQHTTLRVVGELRERGIPAYGPIWDS